MHLHKWVENVKGCLRKCAKCEECQIKTPIMIKWLEISDKEFQENLRKFRNGLEIGDWVKSTEFSLHFSGVITNINSVGEATIFNEKDESISYVYCKWLKKIVDVILNPSRRDCSK